MTTQHVASSDEQLDTPGKSASRLGRTRNLLALLLATFILYTAIAGSFTAMVQRPIVLGAALSLVLLSKPPLKNRDSIVLKAIDVGLVLAAVAASAYVTVLHGELAGRTAFPTLTDTASGIVLSVIVIEATRRIFGLAIPILTAISLVYAYAGNHLSGVLGHPGLTTDRLVGTLYMSANGIFGIALGIAVAVVVIFLMFAAILTHLGGSKTFIDLGMALVGRFRGGSAKASIVSSSLFGMISGSVVANTAAVGPVTIPFMIRGGYAPRLAASVESIASVGGQFVPPIMGSAVFLMAYYIEMPYATIALTAIIPAVLYYLALYVAVHTEATRRNLAIQEPGEDAPRLPRALANAGYLVVPFSVLIALLAYFKTTPSLAAFWAIASLIVIETGKFAYRRRLGHGISQLREAFASAAKGASEIVVVLACIGIPIGVLGITGLSLKISDVLIRLSGGNLLLLLVLVMLAAILMGTALPTTPTYILVAILLAPAIVTFGVPALAAHMFVFYFGVLANITPPTAMAVFVAAKISGTPFFRTCWTAMRLGAVLFGLPYMFVYYPALLLQGEPSDIIWRTFQAVVVIVMIVSAIGGQLFVHLSYFRRSIQLVLGILVAWPLMTASVVGLVGTGVWVAVLISLKASEGRESHQPHRDLLE